MKLIKKNLQFFYFKRKKENRRNQKYIKQIYINLRRQTDLVLRAGWWETPFQKERDNFLSLYSKILSQSFVFIVSLFIELRQHEIPFVLTMSQLLSFHIWKPNRCMIKSRDIRKLNGVIITSNGMGAQKSIHAGNGNKLSPFFPFSLVLFPAMLVFCNGVIWRKIQENPVKDWGEFHWQTRELISISLRRVFLFRLFSNFWRASFEFWVVNYGDEKTDDEFLKCLCS